MLFCSHSKVTHAADGSLPVHHKVLVETSDTHAFLRELAFMSTATWISDEIHSNAGKHQNFK